MAGHGPAPDPNALKRERDEGEWTILPAEGRVGPCPVWPLTDPVKRELDHWLVLWKTPQALMWERFGLQTEVGLYVRALTASEGADAPVNRLTYVRQLAESLGVSVPGMFRNRWRIEAIETTVKKAGPVRSSSRARLTIVKPTDAKPAVKRAVKPPAKPRESSRSRVAKPDVTGT